MKLSIPPIEKRPCLYAFFFALLISAVVFLPFVIMDKGLFFYYGDFNVQQIPFYQMVHRSIRSGDVFWNWYTDLGANFIGSYSFYNLFSPFFWLTLPFPTDALPYLMAPLLVLKTACAGATSCLYISRFVKDARIAVIGSLLYAFSGFATYNIFFNHFHEVIVFFPLLLYALEALVVDGRRCLFALAVALNCMVNYWFFIGTVVFTIIYFVVRSISGGWEMTARKFFSVAFESVLGVVLAAFALFPSVAAILGNPRTTADNVYMGWDFWLFGHTQRIPAIIESIFFPPDIPSRPNFFPDHGAKWASLSAWLPMVGPSLVISYLLLARRTWLRRMLFICLALALVPGLNSVFILFNDSYYARWFYMPLLLMSLCSAAVLERFSQGGAEREVRRGLRYTAVVCAVIALVIGLTPTREEDKTVVGLMDDPARFWIYVALVALGLGCTAFLVLRLRSHPQFLAVSGVMLGCVCVLYSVSMIAMGRMHSDDRDWIRDFAMTGPERIHLPKEDGRFDRVDIYDSMDNLGMYWHMPNIQAFHSIVPVSLMEFYPSVGVKRDVSSKPQPEFFELRSLLSVRWLFVADDEPADKQPSTEYFKKADRQRGFNLYENENYLPVGLVYDSFITREQFESTGEHLRARLLHRAVLVEPDDERNISKIIDPLPKSGQSNLSQDRYELDVKELGGRAASKIWPDKRGFTSEIISTAEGIAFYSVPYDKGWSATVNGIETTALKVNGGFLGVPVSQGYNTIRFDYIAPGLILGAVCSGAGIIILAVYGIVYLRRTQTTPARRALTKTRGEIRF